MIKARTPTTKLHSPDEIMILRGNLVMIDPYSPELTIDLPMLPMQGNWQVESGLYVPSFKRDTLNIRLLSCDVAKPYMDSGKLSRPLILELYDKYGRVSKYLADIKLKTVAKQYAHQPEVINIINQIRELAKQRAVTFYADEEICLYQVFSKVCSYLEGWNLEALQINKEEADLHLNNPITHSVQYVHLSHRTVKPTDHNSDDWRYCATCDGQTGVYGIFLENWSRMYRGQYREDMMMDLCCDCEGEAIHLPGSINSKKIGAKEYGVAFITHDRVIKTPVYMIENEDGEATEILIHFDMVEH